MALDDALKGLARLDPRQSRIVESRFFGGLTIEETAQGAEDIAEHRETTAGDGPSVAAPRNEGQMTPERWQDVQGVLSAALELKPQERPGYLDRALSAIPCARKWNHSLPPRRASAPVSCGLLHRQAHSPPRAAHRRIRRRRCVRRPSPFVSCWWAKQSRITVSWRGSAAAWPSCTRLKTPPSAASFHLRLLTVLPFGQCGTRTAT